MFINENQALIDPSSPHIHVFIVKGGSIDKSIDGAIDDNIFNKMISVSSNGLIDDKAKECVDFINGVCLSLCIISNLNDVGDNANEYPSTHSILGDMTPYYGFIRDNIQRDLSLVNGCAEMLCFMCLPDYDESGTVH